MKLYLYCSYTHSRRGFVMTRLEGDALTACSLSDAEDPGEQMVYRFFSYDTFRVLWQGIPENTAIPVLPGVKYGFFGIRGLRGRISDRDGVVNIAILAERNELAQLDRIAEGILSDPQGFGFALSRCLSVGGLHSYQAEGNRIWELLETVQTQKIPQRMEPVLAGRLSRCYSIRDLLWLAVYVGAWEQAAEYLMPRWIWKLRPKQAISQEEFAGLWGRDLWK